MATDAQPAASPLILAQQRAMPLTRLLDCGMDYADASALMARTTAGEAWDVVAEELAVTQWERAMSARSDGRAATARTAARRCVAAFLFAQMAFNDDTPRKRALYERYVAATALLAELSDGRLERVELPYRNGSVIGWLSLPRAGRPAGTVIVWGGFSGWGAAYLNFAGACNERGLACLMAEGPGQGEPRQSDDLFLDEHVVDGYARFVDAVEADPRLAPAVGVQGNSFGGLFAAHLAHVDARVGACCVNGAPATPTLPEFRVAREQMLAAMGTNDAERAATLVQRLAFDPDSHRLGCRLLVLQGGRDPLATPPLQQPFLRAADPERATLRTWEDGEHTIYNHAEERDAIVADWFASALRPGA